MNDFIFTRRFPERLFRHVVFWLSIYVFSVLTYFHHFFEKAGLFRWTVLELRECTLHVITQMIFSYIVLYFLLPFLYRKKYLIFIFGLLVLSVLTVTLYYYEHITLFRYFHSLAGIPFMKPGIALWFTTISFLTYVPRTAAIVLAIKILKNWSIRQKENQQLMQETSVAELQLLKAQIHPHFLFNTLNNIYSFALTGSSRASTLVKKLADTLNYMISDCDAAEVPLDKELKMIRDYIELETIRYGTRLKMEQSIECTTAGLVTAPLIMITFVENCFKHGTSQMLQNPWIKMNIRASEEELYFHLANSMPASGPTRDLRSGIGLKNVRKRLELLYPGRHTLEIRPLASSFEVNFKIPLRKPLSEPV